MGKNKALAKRDSRGEEENAQSCPCGTADENRTHMVGECEPHEEERNVLEEEMRNIHRCGMEKFTILGLFLETTFGQVSRQFGKFSESWTCQNSKKLAKPNFFF